MSTRIEWCDETINPFPGCSPVSEGCANCYAKGIAKRFPKRFPGLVTDKGEWNGKSNYVPAALDHIHRWKKPRKIFVNSMGDIFYKNNSFEDIDDMLIKLLTCKNHHTYMILTKNPVRMAEYFNGLRYGLDGHYHRIINHPCYLAAQGKFLAYRRGTPFPRIWLGVTTETQKRLDERLPVLFSIDAVIHFISIEPMLGRIKIPFMMNGKLLDWVICGGESGNKARILHPRWIEYLRDQCVGNKVPFFFKQWGTWAPNCMCDGRLKPHQSIQRPQPGPPGLMFKCGKKKSGRLLQGVAWEQFPVEAK